MTPSRPYLLRAFFDWLVDNELTPHLVVDAEQEHVQVPTQFIKDGQIVLNVSPTAVASFSMDMQQVSFSARFGGVPFQVYIPISAVIAIYARENGAGTVFEAEAAYQQAEAVESEPVVEGLSAVESSPESDTEAQEGAEIEDKPKGKSKQNKPSLRVIK